MRFKAEEKHTYKRSLIVFSLRVRAKFVNQQFCLFSEGDPPHHLDQKNKQKNWRTKRAMVVSLFFKKTNKN